MLQNHENFHVFLLFTTEAFFIKSCTYTRGKQSAGMFSLSVKWSEQSGGQKMLQIEIQIQEREKKLKAGESPKPSCTSLQHVWGASLIVHGTGENGSSRLAHSSCRWVAFHSCAFWGSCCAILLTLMGTEGRLSNRETTSKGFHSSRRNIRFELCSCRQNVFHAGKASAPTRNRSEPVKSSLFQCVYELYDGDWSSKHGAACVETAQEGNALMFLSFSWCSVSGSNGCFPAWLRAEH